MTAKLRPIPIWLFLLAPTLALAGNAPGVPEVHRNLRAIESARLRGKVDTLRLDYQEQARGRPSDVTLRIYLAWCAMPNDEAWNALKAIAALHPENPWVHAGMGRIYTGWRMRDQATGSFELALQHSPRFYPALTGLGDVARLAGDHPRAEERYRAALAIQDDAEARAGLGLSLLASGKSEAAKAELSRAIALWPDQPLVLWALAKLSRDAGDLAGAAAHLEALLELSPKDRDGRKALAELRLQLGQKEEAAKEYERYLRLGAMDRDVLVKLAGLYREGGNAEAEERTVQQLSGLERSAPEHPLRLSELAQARGAIDEAEGHLLEAAERAPARADIQLTLARLRVKRGQLREAVEALRAAQRAGGPEGAEAEKEVQELLRQFKLPPKPARGSVDRVYSSVSGTLFALYRERLKQRPSLGGELKLRVRVGEDGRALGVDALEDTVGDPIIAGHVYFALKDAEYPKQKREPVFEFQLRPPKRGGK